MSSPEQRSNDRCPSSVGGASGRIYAILRDAFTGLCSMLKSYFYLDSLGFLGSVTPCRQALRGVVPMASLLTVDDLHVEFLTRDGVVQAVNGVTFSLERGKVPAILGESGSGKASLCARWSDFCPKPEHA